MDIRREENSGEDRTIKPLGLVCVCPVQGTVKRPVWLKQRGHVEGTCGDRGVATAANRPHEALEDRIRKTKISQKAVLKTR